MLKKTIAAGLALSMTLSSFAFAAERDYTAYDKLIASVEQQMSCGWEKTPEDLGVSVMLEVSPETTGWLRRDIDNNGTDELLIGELPQKDWDGVIYDMFTLDAANNPVHVFTGWDRNRWYLLENGMLRNEGSSGADNSVTEYYTYKSGELTKAEAPKDSVKVVSLDFTPFSPASSVSMVNPWTETDAKDVQDKTGVTIGIPEGAENVRWFVLEDAGLGDAEFTLNGIPFSVRFKLTAEAEDLSGLYYENWTTEKATVGYCDATDRRVKDETTGKTIANCLWFDLVPGISYSVTAEADDLDGFDIIAVAEQVFIPMQGDA
ncbi:MAG: hypothetical protein Q4C53_02060 [Clostridia bacterium]|nr:hypothetical protein [Clostridia bacterium]